MVEDNVTKLTSQLRAVMMNKPIPPEAHTNDPVFAKLEDGFVYLSQSLGELDSFLGDLCAGNLNTNVPGRQNFLAGRLKELHAILKHLTWQAEQVANGDYSQKVNFLGEFSESFNRMVQQLNEREVGLSEKTASLARSTALLKSALDSQREWVVVVDRDLQEVVYANLTAKRMFYDPATGKSTCGMTCALLKQLLTVSAETQEWEYACPVKDIVLAVRSVPIEWDGRQAAVCSIANITDEREQQEHLQSLAYHDELTGAYNRRYCIKTLMRMLLKEQPFSLVMLDLDGLKAVNDGMGHQYGDDYIVTVAHTAMSVIREEDRFCRIGGDEFVAILPQCDEAHAILVLERAIQQLSAIQKPFPIRVSYGIAESADEQGITPDELINKADSKMYQMKQAHKNESTGF